MAELVGCPGGGKAGAAFGCCCCCCLAILASASMMLVGMAGCAGGGSGWAGPGAEPKMLPFRGGLPGGVVESSAPRIVY